MNSSATVPFLPYQKNVTESTCQVQIQDELVLYDAVVALA